MGVGEASLAGGSGEGAATGVGTATALRFDFAMARMGGVGVERRTNTEGGRRLTPEPRVRFSGMQAPELAHNPFQPLTCDQHSFEKVPGPACENPAEAKGCLHRAPARREHTLPGIAGMSSYPSTSIYSALYAIAQSFPLPSLTPQRLQAFKYLAWNLTCEGAKVEMK